MAPLGIITIIVSAIRVGGPKWLQAVIGRAKENTAAAEMELMSSTSLEVCELFNGDSIVRCQGTSPVWEFICIFPTMHANNKPGVRLPLRYMSLEKAIQEKLLKVDPQSSLFIPHFVRQNFLSKDQRNSCEMGKQPQSQPSGNTRSTSRSPTTILSLIYQYFKNMNRRSIGSDVELGPSQLLKEPQSSQEPRPSSETRPPHKAQPSHESQSEPFIAVIRDTGLSPPNISLNLQNSHRRAGIRLVAFLGTLLQVGVLVFFGVMSYYPKVQPTFQKEDQPAKAYAAPLAICGTVLLVFGMFICAVVVESSTKETRYRATDGSSFVMCWVQQGQTVSDQVFDSYAMSQNLHCPVITKSARGKDLQDKDNKKQNNALELATICGVMIGLVGFIVQFIGLRAMNSAASLAQLAAIGIMTLCRALVRPGFARSFRKARLLPDFELNWLAWELVTTGSLLGASQRADQDRTWAVVSGDTIEYKQLLPNREHGTIKGETEAEAQDVLLSRREIGKLANLQSKTSEVAVSLASSMEDALNLFLPDGIREANSKDTSSNEANGLGSGGPGDDSSEITWYLYVNYSDASSTKISKRKIAIDLSYHGGTWHVPADTLDATMSLWTHTIRAGEKRQWEPDSEDSSLLSQKGDGWLRRKVPQSSLRLFGPHETIPKDQLLQDLELWVPQCLETLLLVKELEKGAAESDIKVFDDSRVFGCSATTCDRRSNVRYFKMFPTIGNRKEKEDNKEQDKVTLGIESQDSLEHLCAKDLFFSLMCSAAKTPGARVKGEVKLQDTSKGDEDGQQSQFLWNKSLSDLAESCHQRKLGTYQEALICIISALSMAQILPFPHAWFQEVCAKIARAGRNDDEFEVLDICEDLRDRTQCYLPEKSGVKECGAVLLLELLYDVERTPSPMEYIWFHAEQELPDLLGQVTTESNFRSHLRKLPEWSQHLLEFHGSRASSVDDNDDDGDYPGYFMLTESHRKAVRGPIHYEAQDGQKRDIFGRHPLHYLAGSEEKHKSLVLADYARDCRELINVQDYHGYTPLHYACAFGSKENVHHLLEKRARLDIQGLDGMYPMHLAAREGKEEAIDVMLEWMNLPENFDLTAFRRLRDYSGKFPIHWAAIKGHIGVMKRLKADIDLATGFPGFRTPLFLAIRYGGRDAVHTAATLSQDLNRQDDYGETVVKYACAQDRSEYACILIEAGANPTIGNRGNISAIDIAREKGQSDVIEVATKKCWL
ncbi:ankyrin repeat [Fusarium mundagurra]|uniref:Ankyrin repeat n=1 Tax=Fusarium mundagurra TaxID=1567541 RepID=A0A8H5XYU0_9HYPO|nr:ankyrin repeat [Fusarium mundagurra]